MHRELLYYFFLLFLKMIMPFLVPSLVYWISHLSFYRSKITKDGGVLIVQNVPSRVMFPPKALSTCTEVTCSLWNLQILSPPLGRNEALVSSVMELACGNLPGTEERYEFNVKVKVALSHSASDIKGYELVIKELINEKTNDWRDLETRWAWTPSGRAILVNYWVQSSFLRQLYLFLCTKP